MMTPALQSPEGLEKPSGSPTFRRHIWAPAKLGCSAPDSRDYPFGLGLSCQKVSKGASALAIVIAGNNSQSEWNSTMMSI